MWFPKQFPKFFFLFILFSNSFFFQNKYWIFFTDKKAVTFDPYDYFDSKAIERRETQGLPLYDSTDFPVNTNYINAVKQIADSIGKTTRWFNAIIVYAGEEEIKKIKRFSFVKTVEAIRYDNTIIASTHYQTTLTIREDTLLKMQLDRMQGYKFYKNGFDGKGLRIAIFDAGFPTVTTNPAFEEIRKENRIIKTYDFVANKEGVDGYDSHGTMVFSCVAGKIGDKRIGLATGSEFLLARTEYAKREPFSEEENWLAAVEWADKNGVNIINSSLGYTQKRYFPEDMNGKKSLVSRAADMAARKGILIINAAGNEADNSWKKIITPADADSVLTVGGIDPTTGIHIYFSSYGPSADKRLKPNVCAFGHVVAAGETKLIAVDGTSFSSPLTAGFAACAWQANRKLTNMELFHEIERSGELYPYYDYAHGYGVPQAGYFTGEKEEKNNEIPFDVLDIGAAKQVVFKDSVYQKRSNNDWEDYLYYHIENPAGTLDKYYVITVDSKIPLSFNPADYKQGSKIMLHYHNYTTTINF